MKNLIKMVPVLVAGFFLMPKAEAITVPDWKPATINVSVPMESWMFDSAYLETETVTLESWMMDENWLEDASQATPVENWMLDEDYLNVERPAVESWMLDGHYLEPGNDNVN